MDRRKFDRRAVELAKDVLILFLTCSAVWLLIQTRMLEPLHNILREDMPQTQMGQTEGGSRIEAVRPLRIAVNLTAGMETGRYGVQYDQGAADALFQQVAGLLAEGLSSAGQPERVNRYQWEEALTSCPGVYFDFQGDIPLQVLGAGCPVRRARWMPMSGDWSCPYGRTKWRFITRTSGTDITTAV